MGWLGHMVGLLLTFSGPSVQFSTVAAPAYLPANSAWAALSSTSSPTRTFRFFNNSPSDSLSVALMGISPTASGLERLFPWPFVCPLGRNVYSRPLPISFHLHKSSSLHPRAQYTLSPLSEGSSLDLPMTDVYNLLGLGSNVTPDHPLENPPGPSCHIVSLCSSPNS